jgi:hypothetical protein
MGPSGCWWLVCCLLLIRCDATTGAATAWITLNPPAAAAAAARTPAAGAAPPKHVKYMSAYGYNASAQATWCSFGKSFNLSQLVEGHKTFGMPGLYRIDCVGCEGSQAKSPSFAAGIICDLPTAKRPPGRNPYHFCQKRKGDTTDWDEETAKLMALAKPHLLSGALSGIFLGDELTSAGRPQGPSGLTFEDFDRWVNVVAGYLAAVAPARAAAGLEPPILYYTESDYVSTWPYIPHNLTLFSMDDYHPSWMYPSSPVSKCRTSGFPRPAGCENETTGLWVYPVYQASVFPKLGPDTKLLLVPPTYASHYLCNGTGSVWCTNQTYAEWVGIGQSNFSFYRDWAFSDSRIVGFDPWPLNVPDGWRPLAGWTTPIVGLLDIPELLPEYVALGKAIRARDGGGGGANRFDGNQSIDRLKTDDTISLSVGAQRRRSAHDAAHRRVRQLQHRLRQPASAACCRRASTASTSATSG